MQFQYELIAAALDHERGVEREELVLVCLSVVEGVKSKGIETDSDVEARKQMLRKFGYKL